MVPQDAKKVGVARVADKRIITLTLTDTMDENFFTITSNL